MKTAASHKNRVNFTLSVNIIEKLDQLIPAGERSAFVEQAIEEKMVDLSRKKGLDLLRNSIQKEQHIHSTQEILNTIHADRS